MATTPHRKRGRPSDDQSRTRRREEILAVAARVFASRGYQATDMQAVADAAGVAKGTVYLYFRSKEELFLAAVDQGMHDMQTFIDAEVEGITDSLDIIQKAMIAYLSFFKDHPQQVELLMLERTEFRDRKKSSYFEHREKRIERWHALLRDLVAQGRLREMPISRVDDVLCDLLYGTMFTNHFAARHKPLEEQVADILDISFHGILSEAERRRRLVDTSSGEKVV